ncbi:glutamine amidotransferase [Roseicyclus persicicus]|uniref:Glutamine amidotransferase n=1 Tax=Roseicyclus persicicus TaxID=2650661 RepID=A0A7X6JZC5_9RHOB|nr:glutamine amidotransferase [Roseibacterium persicicum]
MRRFLVLQLRPETEAADEEFGAFLQRGGLAEADVHRVRLDEGPLPALSLDDYAGVIVGGGPGCVSDPPETKDPLEARIEADILSLMPEVLARDMPFLGCCYGMGILGHSLGAPVGKGRYGEPIGGVDCAVTEAGAQDPLLAGLPGTFRALVGHKEAVEALPDGAVHLVASGPCPFQMIRAGANVYATQFHPEAEGVNFASRIAIYKDRGYFDPADAARLTAACLAEEITVPQRILSGFVRRFRV